MIKLHNYNIILPKYLEIVKKKGSSLTFSAPGGRGKEKNQKPAAKNFASPSEGEAEGGCGGNSASPELKRSPAALLVQSRVPQKSFLFLLIEKIGRAQNIKLRRKLFCGTVSEANGGGAERQFRSKKVRAKFRISHKNLDGQDSSPHIIPCQNIKIYYLKKSSKNFIRCTICII
jgi:hypothetical protein